MESTISIANLTKAKKLRLMDALWADMSQNEAGITSPPWHGDVLAQRQQRVDTGEATFNDWDDAKKRLRDQTS